MFRTVPIERDRSPKVEATPIVFPRHALCRWCCLADDVWGLSG